MLDFLNVPSAQTIQFQRLVALRNPSARALQDIRKVQAACVLPVAMGRSRWSAVLTYARLARQAHFCRPVGATRGN